LQVAQLAGVPQAVIRAARKHLASLEANSMQATPQFDLFADPGRLAAASDADALHVQPSPSAIDAALAALNPDALSPREALDALYRLKELSNQHEQE
jgi:DNA mismatch repair protein MutS